jgi:DMSO/TMAO reductase YedYZ molybdopterin-dependent catalytic subunit
MFGFGRDPKLQSETPPSPEEAGDGVIISPDTRRENRIPPRQARTRKWPVLDASGPPHIDLERWRFTVTGLVETPLEWTWEEFQRLPRVQVFADMHCVTRWSRLGNLWEGVSTREVLNRSGVRPNAAYALAYGYDRGWSANMPLEAFLQEDCLFADKHDGEPLDAEHGGPLRLVIPRLYAWKSAKWVRGIELVERDRPGFWERGGYHMHGDPWKEERFRADW